MLGQNFFRQTPTHAYFSLTSPDTSERADDLTGADATASRDLVDGLIKGLQVIEAFDQERSRLTISEVAQRANLTRAAARRYLLTLVHLGYARQQDKVFSLTPKVLRLGQSYLHSARLPRVVQPLLYRLAYALGEAASVGILEDDDLVCVAAVGAGRVISATLQPGTRVPAFCTANGRVLLASLPDAVLHETIARLHIEALTEHTIVNKDRLLLEIVRARAQGYALVNQELELGLRAIAVPLRNFRGEVVAALNVSVHESRMAAEHIAEHCLPALLKVQAELMSLL
ncbi:MAG: beta-ketoadipate pathway transcriptional regulator, PcaR/PcaU/PobR family protein [Massilia sp.]|nr:beta-ketoadipate pathway transcriptional regulator, PcaR/PcaU/PobR family protein [Massilia sp.]